VTFSGHISLAPPRQASNDLHRREKVARYPIFSSIEPSGNMPVKPHHPLPKIAKISQGIKLPNRVKMEK